MRRARHARQRGAVLLLAMLLVAMVAIVCTAGQGRHWRDTELEAAERARVQTAWLLDGALDWARLVLREDAQAGGLDHLGEAWAAPLGETRLSAFLGASGRAGSSAPQEEAFLSGRIVDLQSRLNVSSIAATGSIAPAPLRAFQRLFDVLGLPRQELAALAENLRRASIIDPESAEAAGAPAPPRRIEHLAALGLAPATLAALAPYIAVLPGRTPLNLNTASAEVIYSAVDGITLDDARRMVAHRMARPLRSLEDAAKVLGGAPTLPAGEFSVASRYFEVLGRVSLDGQTVAQRTLVQRVGLEVAVLGRWPERWPTGHELTLANPR